MTRQMVAAFSPSRWLPMRRALRSDVWGTTTLPTTQPTVTLAYTGTSYGSMFPAEVTRVDQIVASLPGGATNTMHLLRPAAPENRVLIVWGGHSISYHAAPAAENGEGMVRAALDAGWYVLGGCMPVEGYNPSTFEYNLAGGGTTTINGHDDAATIEADGTHPFRWFIEPVIQAINYLELEYGFERIAMTGISGGGWTTDFAAALDPRIGRSYPTFGSMPFSMRTPSGPGDGGDWEQFAARSWWETLTQPGRDHELAYLLGCVDSGRRRMQVLGDNEPVFPALTVHVEILAYEAWVDERVPVGQHDVLIDTTAASHQYSAETIAAIVADMTA